MNPNRVQWTPQFSVGNATIDAQHQQLLAECNALADLCADGGNDIADPQFMAVYDRLMALAHAHFATEEALLQAGAYPESEAYHFEIDEYGYLAEEIATAENFDKIELQRFLALWWVGHILGATKSQASYLA